MSVGKWLIEKGAPEQIAAAPPELFYFAAMMRDTRTCKILVDKECRAEPYARDILRSFLMSGDSWTAERLLKNGMEVSPDNYAAMAVCLENHSASCAKILLDRGMDSDAYLQWELDRGRYFGDKDTRIEVQEHWDAMRDSSPQFGGISV